MKRSMVMTLTIGTLAVVALVAACAAPAAESPAPPQVTEAQLRAVSDLERMETMQCSVGMLINQYWTNGGVVPDYLYDQVNSIQKAKQDLLNLEGQRCATHMLIAQYVMSGQEVPDCRVRTCTVARASPTGDPQGCWPGRLNAIIRRQIRARSRR